MGILDATLTRMMARSVRHVGPLVRPASQRAADVYAQMRDETGLLPPFLCQAAHPEVLAAAWVAAREAWLAGPVGRLEREAVAAGVSEANRCPFCVEAHTMTLRAGTSRAGTSRAGTSRAGTSRAGTATGRSTSPAAGAPDVGAWFEWASAPPDSGPGERPPAPFAEAESPWFVGTAVVFHYVNRVVNVLLADSAVPGVVRALGPLGGRLSEVLVGEPMLSLHPEPGRALDLLPPAGGGTPRRFPWAAADAVVSEAFARADAAMASAGDETVPPRVRELLVGRVRAWDGELPGPSRAWVEEATDGLDATERPVAVLALLVAFASYQVDDAVVARFRERHPSDAELVATVGWSAWQAATRIGDRSA